MQMLVVRFIGGIYLLGGVWRRERGIRDGTVGKGVAVAMKMKHFYISFRKAEDNYRHNADGKRFWQGKVKSPKTV